MLKRALRKIALAGALTVGAAVYHVFDPTLIPRTWYTIKDPFITTQTEQKIEDKYGIDYEGDSDEQTQIALEENLRQIKKTNPGLLKHCTKIVLHPYQVTSSPAIAPFVDFAGRAFYTGMIELTTTASSTLVHELAHTKHFEVEDEFEEKLDALFENSYSQGLKTPTYWYGIKRIAPTNWDDGSIQPRNGFVLPYGANNSRENVATYVEEAYYTRFWEKPEVQDEKYTQTLALLRDYNFITQQQYDDILKTIRANNLDLIKQKLETALKDLETPKLVKQEYFDFGGEEVYYKNDNIKIYRSFFPHSDDSIWIELKIGESDTKQFRIDRRGTLTALHPNEHLVPQTILDRLTEKGYADLFDQETYTALIRQEPPAKTSGDK